MAKKGFRADHRADLRGKPFIGLPAAVLQSDAYTSASLAARAVLLEILARFNGYNNGEIAVSSRELGARLNTSNARRIGQAVRELFERGLIDIAVEGKWKARQARLYRLTFISSSKAPPHKQATNDYATIPRRAFSGDDNASAVKPRFAERASAGTLGLADIASAANHGNAPFGGKETADNASALISMPYEGPQLEAHETKPDHPLIPDGPNSTIVAGPWTASACEACGETFEPGNRGKPKRFCSEPCRKRAESRRRNQRNATRS